MIKWVLTCSEERTDKATSPRDLYTTEVYMLETSSSDGNRSSEDQTEELELIKTAVRCLKCIKLMALIQYINEERWALCLFKRRSA